MDGERSGGGKDGSNNGDSPRDAALSGRYLPVDGRPPAPAYLFRQGESLMLSTGAGDARETHAVTLTRVSDRLGNVPRKLYFADGGALEFANNDIVDDFLGAGRQSASRIAALEGSRRWVAVAVVVCVVTLVSAYRYGLPLAASFAANVTPSVVMMAIDAGSLQTLDRALFDESGLPGNQRERVRALFAQLEALTVEKEPPLELLFRDGGRIGANAFALPGGTVVITDQLVRAAKSDDEIAGVLAHEIGHVAERHSLQQLYRAAGLYVLAGMITGDGGQLIDEVVAQAGLLQTSAYQRGFEQAADHHGAELMLRAGRDPEAILALFDRLAETCGEACEKTGLLSSHPGMRERRKDIRETVKRLRDEGL